MNEQRSGWVTFAGVMLLLVGTLNVIYGIAAIGDSSFFVNDTRFIFGNRVTPSMFLWWCSAVNISMSSVGVTSVASGGSAHVSSRTTPK